MERVELQSIADTGQAQAIRVWNQERDNTKFDVKLEQKMLTEEFAEFFASNDLVDKLDAIADFIFVYEGTIYKILYNNVNISEYEDLIAMAQTLFVMMYEDLKKDIPKEDILVEAMDKTLDIVIEANQQKGKTKNKEGKIQKPKDFVKPEERIKKEVVDSIILDYKLKELGLVELVEAYRKHLITKNEFLAILEVRYNQPLRKPEKIGEIIDSDLVGSELYDKIKKNL